MKLAKSLGSVEYLSLTPSNQSVSYGAGTTNFSLSSNVSWTVSDDASWLTVSPSSGANSVTITATYTENTSSTPRTATIQAIGGGITRTVTVIQQGTSGTTCPPAMISYWKLDETSGSVYADNIGVNNATSTNTPTPVAGRVGGAQQFNGTSNKITAPRIAAYDFTSATSFTFEAWINHPVGSFISQEINCRTKSSGPLYISLNLINQRVKI